MEFRQIHTNQELLEAISIGFFEDQELFDKYHCLTNGSYYECVNDTYKKVLDASVQYPLEWYEVIEGGKKIGFTIICKAYNFLYSFAINKFNRTSQILINWFNTTKSLLGEYFNCSLWSKNQRAINFLLRCDMKILSQQNEITQLTNSICP
jgi:hypothetical protein